MKTIIYGVIAIAILVGIIIYQRNDIIKKDAEIGRVTNNYKAYQDLESNNRVLQLKLSDLRNSNDKMIQSLDSTRNALKLAKKDLKQASVVKTSIDTEFTEKITRDSIKTKTDSIIVNCDFTLNKQLNSETNVDIKSVGDSITVKLKIQNTQYLFVYSSKEWRNERKNWFDRLFHWDWKKDLIFRYEITNSNPLIEIQDTRIIEIQD